MTCSKFVIIRLGNQEHKIFNIDTEVLLYLLIFFIWSNYTVYILGDCDKLMT